MFINLQELENRSILLFGKPRAFSNEEFLSQMKYHKIEVLKEYSDDILLLVDGKMMTPSEQNLSDELYESKKLNAISIDILERELASSMDSNTLLMSLKLSGDKERLKSFIQNSMIPDELFFRLIKMYSWAKEDFFENDDNRDVSAAFISRFYENIERNHNVQYATTGFIHLVSQVKTPELLAAIYELEPMAFHPKIKMAIAMSIYIDESMQERFFKTQKRELLEALSFNKKLKLSLVKELMKEQEFCENIAKTVELNNELFLLLKSDTVSLAKNETLDLKMQEELLSLESDAVSLSLSQNNSLDISIVETLLKDENEAIQKALHQNSATPSRVLDLAYKNDLFHLELAKNEATPVEILYQLQLDSRYERAVKTNAAFGKHIQSENIGWLV